MTDVFGWLAMIGSIVYLCFGLPVQIYTNYKRKSTEGLSVLLIVFCAIALLMWILYAGVQDPIDWYILGSNAPGFVFALMLLAQFWVYRPGKKGESGGADKDNTENAENNSD